MAENDGRTTGEGRWDRRLPNRTSAGSTGQAGQSSVDSPGFSERGRKGGRQGLTDPSRDWPGPDEETTGTKRNRQREGS